MNQINVQINMNIDEFKYAILVHLFTKTGVRIEPDNCELHFIKDGNSVRVDEIKLMKKV